MLKAGGARAIPIDYNISEEDFAEILKNVNGMIIPDGGLSIVNPDTGRLHSFFRATKQTLDYSRNLKDTTGETFPVFGIGQGLYFLAMTAVEDISILSEVFVANENRKVHWNIENPKENSRMYHGFDQEVLDIMTYENVNYQLHEVAIRS